MPTTRPGFIWSGTEWVAIGQEAVVNPFYYQATAPTGATTGAIWIDSDDEAPGITSALNYRWRLIATGGETSLSGNDGSGLPLAYNPGYEQLYINGVLQYRGSDYFATTGTTITGLTALVANDTVEVLSFVTAPIGDAYGQAASDAKYYSKTSSASSGEASTVNISTKPWNIPWGIQYHNATINNTVTSSTVAGLTTSFTFLSNRRYKVSAMISCLNNSGRVLGTIAAGSLGSNRFFDMGVVTYFNPSGYLIVSGTGTSQSITVGFVIVSGSSTLQADNLVGNYHSLTIEDIGPV